ERESYKRRDEYRSIFVVTSDGPEQNQVLGHGSYRLAVADLERMLKQDKKRQHTFIKTNNLKNMRSEIGRNLPVDVQAKLERLRKK
ncbi:MAG: NYN domain-containing protein, partial [Dialister micraerophilus]|nr:NYN domain-containing protein [Dialister micraerophilus]